MTMPVISAKSFLLNATLACSLALWAGTDGASAGNHNGSDHHQNGNKKKVTTQGPVHGPGSSHNPIVYHPVHGPGSTHNPILATKPVVRDHRNPGGAHGPYGGRPSGGAPEGGVTVTGAGGNKVPTQVDGGRVFAEPGNGLYNPPPPIVRDHR